MKPEMLPTSVVRAGRATIREYGMLTAPLRATPDFLLIGAKRGGSTSFYYSLLQHPAVLPLFPSARWLPKANDTKGVHYFDSHYERGEMWYRSHFPTRSALRRAGGGHGGRAVVGEGSPYYLFHPLAAERAGHEVPATRILLVLRDPVERAFSHFRERRRQRAEKLETFEDALAAEGDRLEGEEERILADPRYRSYAHEQQSYRAQSEYAPALRRWLKHFPRERVHVVAAEEFYSDPRTACADAFTFLGLDPVPLRSSEVWNPAPSQELGERTRRRLAEHFEPFNTELEELVGRSFNWTRP